MAITQTITCDMCGKQKQKVNHWYLVKRESHLIVFRGWESVIEKDKADFSHVCGQECAIKKLSEWMQK